MAGKKKDRISPEFREAIKKALKDSEGSPHRSKPSKEAQENLKRAIDRVEKSDDSEDDE